MSTPTLARATGARWLHSSIAIGSTLVIVAAIAVVLMLRSPSHATPASRSIPAGVDIYAPLDQHERHPELFDASGEKEVGARDQWRADPKQDDPNAARDAWWLDK